jgi:hypothetical protein
MARDIELRGVWMMKLVRNQQCGCRDSDQIEKTQYKLFLWWCSGDMMQLNNQMSGVQAKTEREAAEDTILRLLDQRTSG